MTKKKLMRRGAVAILAALGLFYMLAALGCSGDSNPISYEIECTTSIDCAEYQVCKPDGTCGSCTRDAQCQEADSATPYCAFGVCGQCKNGPARSDGTVDVLGCMAGQICQDRRCVDLPEPDCEDDSDCQGDNQWCTNGYCVGCRNDRDCEDEDNCTLDHCSPNGCEFTRTCQCLTDVDCPPSSQVCHLEDFVCLDCTDDMHCDDRDNNTTDFCHNGECRNVRTSGCVQDTDCNDGDECTFDSCNDGACVYTTGLCECQDDSDCNDNNTRTTDLCQNHNCRNVRTSGCVMATDCADGDECTFDSCNAGACVHTPGFCECETTADCPDDGNDCTFEYCETDTCQRLETVCACLSAADCEDDGVACTFEYCNLGACVVDDARCACTTETQATNCDDSDECTFDYCTTDRMCAHLDMDTDECNDDDTPSTGDACTAPGSQILGPLNFEERLAPFEQEDSGDATVNMVRTDAAAHAGSRSMRIDCTADSTPLFYECMAKVITNAFSPGRSYTISFWAKAAVARDDVRIEVIRDTSPFTPAGLTATSVHLTTSWERYELPFVGLAVDEPHRVSINTGFRDGSVWIDDFVITCH